MKTVLLLVSFLPIMSFAQIEFIDVAAEKGITYQGKSFGSSWGDIDGNGFPDLFVSNHANRSDLYYANDLPVIYSFDGTVFSPTIVPDLGPILTTSEDGTPIVDGRTDWHGSAFVDVDRDGDLDQVITRGGTSSNVFYLNNNGLIDIDNQALEFNLEYVPASGRTPGLVDINNDGLTDLILNGIEEAQGPNVPRLMINSGGNTFVNESMNYGFDWAASVFSTSNDFMGDGGLDIISLSSRPTIYEVNDEMFETVQAVGSNKVFDFLIEDLNGDLLPDIFSVRADRRNYVERLSSSLIRSHFRVSASVDPISFEFTSLSALVEFTVLPRSQNVPFVLVIGDDIGSEITGVPTTIALDANDPDVIGNPEIELDSAQPRIYIRYDTGSEKWIVTAKSGLGASIPFGLTIEGSDLALTDSFPNAPNLGAELFYNEGDYIFTEQNLPIFNETDNFTSVVAADFDNDMDIDLYAVRMNFASNKENVLWENDNNLNWIRHDGAWGASGDGEGIGESVTVVDFNNDGFMDLFVTNGTSVFWLNDANTNLYENQSNGNNWLKVELKGVLSDPIGIHSRVILYAGGTAQLRYQDGGMHRFSQNDTRLHFGLAQNSTIDSLEVFWPSGIRQVITDLDINQIATITEALPCEEPYAMAENLSAEIQPNGVLLQWDPVPGSIGCQIRGGRANSQNLQLFRTLVPNAKEFFAPQGQLVNGQEYRWQVRCGCTTSIIGAWSPFDLFTWNAGSMKTQEKNKFTFYPNPVFTELNVALDVDTAGDFTALFFDLQGRVVKGEMVYVELNQMLRFDLSDLESGVYIFQISNGEVTVSEKIIKQ